MSRILHLSDLHLSDTILDNPLGDYKSDSITREERLNVRTALEWTIKKWVDKVRELGPLDAVVISGDITVANQPDGWEYFSKFLDWLEPVLPQPDRVIVVPGNHDVARDVDRDANEHYRNFIRYIRDERKFVTPMLEGIDPIDNAAAHDLSSHILVDPDHKWAIIPINSTDYCGVKEPIDPLIEDEWIAFTKLCNSKAGSAAMRSLQDLRIHDMARISWPQMRAIHALCSEAKRVANCNDLTLIGVVHHQLLPVNTREEVKPYEALTNLGHFREVLAKNKFSVMLHGHKHAGRIFIDYIATEDNGKESPAHRLAIISSPAIGYVKDPHQALFRELEIVGEPGRAVLNLQDVRCAVVGTSITMPKPQSIHLWQTATHAQLQRSAGQFVEGETLDEVYDKARALFADKAPDKEIQNVICRVASGVDNPDLPQTYPKDEVRAIADEENWLGTIVEWWQKDGFSKLAPDGEFKNGIFNHGTILFGNGGRQPNQINNIIDVLGREHESSKGIATLVDPRKQQVHMEDVGFPSFCFVHFIVAEENSEYYLDVIAYFRKQEIKFWWPVNYAELSILQGKVVDGLRPRLRKKLNRGTITTIAALAKSGSHVPNIMVPKADMIFEEMGNSFWEMTYAICQPMLPGRDAFLDRWNMVCCGLTPADTPSLKEFIAPTQSLEALSTAAEPFAQFHPEIRDLQTCWDSIHAENKRFNGMGNSKRDADYLIWRTSIENHVLRVRQIIEKSRKPE